MIISIKSLGTIIFGLFVVLATFLAITLIACIFIMIQEIDEDHKQKLKELNEELLKDNDNKKEN